MKTYIKTFEEFDLDDVFDAGDKYLSSAEQWLEEVINNFKEETSFWMDDAKRDFTPERIRRWAFGDNNNHDGFYYRNPDIKSSDSTLIDNYINWSNNIRIEDE